MDYGTKATSFGKSGYLKPRRYFFDLMRNANGLNKTNFGVGESADSSWGLHRKLIHLAFNATGFRKLYRGLKGFTAIGDKAANLKRGLFPRT